MFSVLDIRETKFILPRFFPKYVLKESFKTIPTTLMQNSALLIFFTTHDLRTK